MQILTLTLGGNDFGIPLEDVEHIEERVDNIVKLPATPEYIKGLVTVRGVVMPVYSLAVRFGYAEETIQYLIVAVIDGMKLGIEVDKVNGVIDVKEKEIFPLPVSLRGVQQYFLKNIVLFRQKQLIVLIDLNQLMVKKERDEISQIMAEHMINCK